MVYFTKVSLPQTTGNDQRSLTQGPQYINITCSVCSCSSNFYGSQCEVDGEVLGVAVGASVAAVVIIVLTLVCLCMWRWVKRNVVTYITRQRRCTASQYSQWNKCAVPVSQHRLTGSLIYIPSINIKLVEE